MVTKGEGKAWPEDVRPQWFNVIRRLQSVARESNQGLAVMQIKVMVDGNGTPVIWTEPVKVLLEPKRAAEQVLEMLFEEMDD
jgi:hypothetical protein